MTSRTNGSLELRPMFDSDIPHALRIINEYDEDDALEARETYNESLDGQFCLCERGKVIGVVGAKPIDNTDRSFGLSWTYLQRADRRSGKGSLMLEWMIDIIREMDGRKAFVHTSDYQDPEEGDVYFDAREAYMKAGFIQELRQPDFYAPGESMIVYGMRLQPRVANDVVLSLEGIRLTDVDEIPETNDAYWLAWELVSNQPGSSPTDFERIIKEVQAWGGRSIYMAFPSDVANAASLLSVARFRVAGRLADYYEDGVDEVHYRYDLLS